MGNDATAIAIFGFCWSDAKKIASPAANSPLSSMKARPPNASPNHQQCQALFAYHNNIAPSDQKNIRGFRIFVKR